MQVAARAAAAALLPFAMRKTAVSAVAVHVAHAGPTPARRGGLAGARLARAEDDVHVVPAGTDAAERPVANAGGAHQRGALGWRHARASGRAVAVALAV